MLECSPKVVDQSLDVIGAAGIVVVKLPCEDSETMVITFQRGRGFGEGYFVFENGNWYGRLVFAHLNPLLWYADMKLERDVRKFMKAQGAIEISSLKG